MTLPVTVKALPCGHPEEYRCRICRNCCQCTHEYVKRPDGWWIKCKKILKWHKCEGPGMSKSLNTVQVCVHVPCPLCTGNDYEVNNDPGTSP